MQFYQSITDEKAIAAVYEEGMDWDQDPPTCEYEAWAVTAYGIERIYTTKHKLETHCQRISEDATGELAPALIETLHLSRPDETRPAKASPHFVCEHGEGCPLAEHSQSQLWRDAQHV